MLSATEMLSWLMAMGWGGSDGARARGGSVPAAARPSRRRGSHASTPTPPSPAFPWALLPTTASRPDFHLQTPPLPVSSPVFPSLTSSAEHIFRREGSFRPIFFLTSTFGRSQRALKLYPLLTAVSVSGRDQASSCPGTVCSPLADFSRASSSW